MNGVGTQWFREGGVRDWTLAEPSPAVSVPEVTLPLREQLPKFRSPEPVVGEDGFSVPRQLPGVSAAPDHEELLRQARRHERREWMLFAAVMSVCLLLWLLTMLWFWMVLRADTSVAQSGEPEPSMQEHMVLPDLTVPVTVSLPAETIPPAPAKPVPKSAPRPATKHEPDVKRRLLQAYEWYSHGELARAERAYASLLGSGEGRRGSLLGLAMIAGRQDRPVEAAAYYQQVLRRDPLDDAAATGLLSVYARVPPDQAREALQHALAREPQQAYWHYILGSLSLQWQQDEQATQLLRRAVQLRPGQGGYHYNLAVACDRRGLHGEAIANYRLALQVAGEHGFDPEQVRVRLRQLGEY